MFVALLFLSGCGEQPVVDEDAGGVAPPVIDNPIGDLVLEPVTGITLISPASSPSFNPSPVLRVDGVASGELIEVHYNADCTSIAAATNSTDTFVNVTVAGLSPGTYSLFARRVEQSSGLISACSSMSVAYEVVSSSLTVTGLSNDVTPTQSKNWSWSCSGSVSSCEYRYVVNNDAGFTFSSEPYGSTTSASVSSGDGTFYLHVQARDASFPSTESSQVSVSAAIDNTAPLAPSGITLGAALNPLDNDDTPNIEVSGVSSGDTVNLFTDSCVTNVGSSVATGASVEVISGSLLDGAYTFYTNAVDVAGNISSCSAVSVSYVLDTVVPTVAITSAPDITAANQNTYSVVGACSESGQSVDLNIGSLNVVVVCSSGSFSSGAVDISGQGDSASFLITADHQDAATNSAISSSVTVSKDTLSDTVAIVSAPDIDNVNDVSYEISGTCSGNGSDVEVVIGSLNFTATCSSGLWSLSNLNVSALTDGPMISVTADHLTAPQASTSIAKDSAAPTVAINSAPNITSSNELSYNMSGTCSENSQNVDLAIGTITFTVTCSSGTWVSGSQDVSSLADSGSITITADHENASAVPANQAVKMISKNTATPVVTALSVPATLTNSADLSWNLVDPGGFTINDFEIQYRVKGSSTWLNYSDGVSVATSATVSGLLAGTTYEFQVRVSYDSSFSDYSEFAEGATKPDNPIFDSPYKAMNVGGATTTNVVAFDDDTYVTLNGVTIPESPLGKGQVVNLTTVQFDVIDADKPIFTAGRRGSGGNTSKANVVWSPAYWAGKNFSFNAIRDNAQELYVYATESSVVEVRQGTTVLDAITLSADGSGTLQWSQYGSYQVVSTGTILAYHTSRGSGLNRLIDPKPLLPSHTEIIGVPSNSMRLTANNNGTNYNLYHSNSNTGSGSLDASGVQSVNPGQSGNQYQASSLLVTSDQPVSGASFADSDGNCAAPFVPTNLMKTKYVINSVAEWVAFASKQSGTIDVYSPTQTIGVDPPVSTINLTNSGGGSNAPYKARMTNVTAGYRFVSSVPMAVWYEPNTDTGAALEDETILYGSD